MEKPTQFYQYYSAVLIQDWTGHTLQQTIFLTFFLIFKHFYLYYLQSVPDVKLKLIFPYLKNI